MAILDKTSVARTAAGVEDARLLGEAISKTDRTRTAMWLADRQGGKGCYHGLYVPAEGDMGPSMSLYTGEKVSSDGGRRHILGEEANRALVMLGHSHQKVRDALAGAQDGMASRLAKARMEDKSAGRGFTGLFCCGKCSVSLWRNLLAGGFPDIDGEAWISAGLRTLKAHRKGDGTWKRYPYWFTMLALAEMDLPAARSEMRYAAKRCERKASRKPKSGDIFDIRRHAVAEQVLAQI